LPHFSPGGASPSEAGAGVAVEDEEVSRL
jgi:hypothetical protein